MAPLEKGVPFVLRQEYTASVMEEVVREGHDGDVRLLGGSSDESAADRTLWSDTGFNDQRR